MLLNFLKTVWHLNYCDDEEKDEEEDDDDDDDIDESLTGERQRTRRRAVNHIDAMQLLATSSMREAVIT